MCLKHFIDRYNIYYVYGPSKISRNIHATAINFVIISIILMQMCVFFFLYLRNGKHHYLGIYFKMHVNLQILIFKKKKNLYYRLDANVLSISSHMPDNCYDFLWSSLFPMVFIPQPNFLQGNLDTK